VSDDDRIATLRAATSPYVRPFRPAHLLKWPHDCRAFRWLLAAMRLRDPHGAERDARAREPDSGGSGASMDCGSQDGESTGLAEGAAWEGLLPMPPWVRAVEVDREANAQLAEYVAESDIDAIRFVAVIVAQTISSALLLAWARENREAAGDAAALTPALRVAAARYEALLPRWDAEGGEALPAAALAAWQPMQLAMKQAWWECASVPDEVDRGAYLRSLR